MKKNVSTILFLAIALFLTACSGTKADSDGIVGAYDVTGTNPDGSTYEVVLDVVAAAEAFTWSWNSGEYTGVALQQDDVVSVAWGDSACYVVSYVIGEDGVLSDKWTDMAISGIGTDVATPTDDMGEGIEGLYNAVGTNPDGSEYGCLLQVTKLADNLFEWYWSSCGEYLGIGIQAGNVVSVAYGADSCSAMSYKVEKNGALDATWVYVGQTDLGTELATPK